MNLNEIYGALISGGAASGITGGMIVYFIRHWILSIVRENKDLKKELADLRDNRVQKLENSLEEHISKDDNRIEKLEDNLDDHIAKDDSKAVMVQLKLIAGTLSKIGDKVDNISNATAKQQAEIDGVKHYVGNLDKSLQRHKESKHHA